VNSVRPVGFAPAGPFFPRLNVSRAALIAGAGVLAALNAQAGQIINERTYQSLGSEIHNLIEISAVIWFAMYAVLQIGFERDSPAPANRDKLVIAAVIALCFLPFALAAKAALLLCGIYSFQSSRSGDPLRRVALVLLALTGPLIWGPLILIVFAGPLLSLDAHLVGAAIGMPVDGNLVQFASGGRRFLIGIPCSSVHNISLALVLWTTAAALFRVRFDIRYISCGIAMVGFMFGLNILRLSLIGQYPASFTFLHDGLGADLFGWGALMGVGLLAFLGVERAVKRRQ
jgi:hypothetical protein